MSNWITIRNTAGEVGDALINLDSGMVVQRVSDHAQNCEYVTRIWSLHSGKRYLSSTEDTFDRIQETVQRNTTVDYYSKINEIRWSQRVANCFHTHGIEHISDLISKSKTDLLKLRFFGRGCLSEVIRNLADHNLELSE
jgi:DNA-directed RNA polymerase alpha subunit